VFVPRAHSSISGTFPTLIVHGRQRIADFAEENVINRRERKSERKGENEGEREKERTKERERKRESDW